MTISLPRTARLLAGGATAALLALGLSVGAVAPASAAPLVCTGADLRSPSDKLPKPAVVVPFYDAATRVTYYDLMSVDEAKRPYYLTVNGPDFDYPVAAAWENSTACDGDDESRNGWAVTPGGAVYADGTVYAGAPARYFGGANTLALKRPVVGMSATGTGDGYWLVAGDGGIFTYGDARFFGSTGALRLNKPVVGMSTTPDGRGYWLVASDGGIFTFGNATFKGSTGALRLDKPITGMVATPTGKGYWLVASDGGVFTFGDAAFKGSLAGRGVTSPVVGLVPAGSGYVLFTADGTTHPF